MKAKILKALGSNLTVYDRTLRIDGEKAWLLIEKDKQEVINELQWLEPGIKDDISVIIEPPEAASLSWLALVDDFQTINWSEVFPYPQLVYQQSQQYLQAYAH